MLIWLMEGPTRRLQTGRRYWRFHYSFDIRSFQPCSVSAATVDIHSFDEYRPQHRCGTDLEQASTGLLGVDITFPGNLRDCLRSIVHTQFPVTQLDID